MNAPRKLGRLVSSREAFDMVCETVLGFASRLSDVARIAGASEPSSKLALDVSTAIVQVVTKAMETERPK